MKRIALATTLLLASPVFACGACGCTLNSDWSSQGYGAGAGFRLDFRFDYFDQDQLRNNLDKVDPANIHFPNEREIQKQTINRNSTMTLDYSPNADWGFTAMIPLYDRTHETVAEGDTETSSSRSAGIGDVRLLGRYQGFRDDHSFGIQFGVKLATGRTTDVFKSGPQEGEPVDAGLQLGTGTTDLLFGVYKFGNLAPDWGYFAQALGQVAVAGENGFRPGNGLNLNAGVRYTGYASVTPQFQMNVRAEKPETGINADTPNSGATLAYLSPGVTVHLSNQLHIYAFVQVPIYQRVSGYQIEPRFLASVGVHYNF